MAQRTDFGSTPAEREKAFIMLYKKAFPGVAKYVSKMGGSLDDAKDIFQDALVIYYEKTIDRTVEMRVTEEAYLAGISKHLWIKKFREGLMFTGDEPTGMDLSADDETYPSSAKLMHLLETAGQKCMEILKAFYYDHLPVGTITKLFGYSGVRSATVQKYKCMEKVRETIKERSLTYEDFTE